MEANNSKGNGNITGGYRGTYNSRNNGRSFTGRSGRPAVLRRRINVMAFICLAALIAALSGIIVKANAVNPDRDARYKYYTSIDIQKDDTLWGIAERYISEDENINDYINELKTINRLSTDNITEGRSLIIYYYSYDAVN